MKRLNVFCEGQTEQGFCKQVLQPHFFPTGDGRVLTLAVGEKNHRHFYGISARNNYKKIKKFIENTIKGRQGDNVIFTTMFDLYALPDDFPGKAIYKRDAFNPEPYVIALQRALDVDISHPKFFAYLQLHEYETMLFADPGAFAIAFEDCADQIQRLEEIVASVQSIEHIDEGRETAPSKRIIGVFPEYEGRKSTAGPDIAEFIGLEKIRAACPHLDSWLNSLEKILWE